MRAVTVATIAATLIVQPACSLAFDARALGVPVTLAEPAGTPPRGETFSVNRKAVFFLWGVLAGATPSLGEEFAGQLIDGSSVTDVKIKVKSGVGDVIVTLLTLGLIVPRTVTYEGRVVPPSPSTSTPRSQDP